LAAVEHDHMADGHAVADGQRLAGVGMQDAAVLDIGVPPDCDRIVVAPDRRAKPDAGARLENHVSYDGCGRCDPVFALRRELRLLVTETVNIHHDTVISKENKGFKLS